MRSDSRNANRASQSVGRRDILKTAGVGVALMTLGAPVSGQERSGPAATRGRIRQSIAYWCVEKYWSVEQTCRIARDLGCRSVELVEPKDWPTLNKYGLVCAIHSSHGFDQGMNNPKYQPACLAKLRESIDACAEYKFPNVITFTGFREDTLLADRAMSEQRLGGPLLHPASRMRPPAFNCTRSPQGQHAIRSNQTALPQFSITAERDESP